MTGGVVRRDGLREAVEALRDEWSHRVYNAPPSGGADWRVGYADALRGAASDLARVLDAMPDDVGARKDVRVGTLGSDEKCHRCGGENVNWCAPSPLWNLVMRGNDIDGDPLFGDLVCLRCFAVLADEAGPAGQWRLFLHPDPIEHVMSTPTGRVWDAESWMWREPADALDAVPDVPPTEEVEGSETWTDRSSRSRPSGRSGSPTSSSGRQGARSASPGRGHASRPVSTARPSTSRPSPLPPASTAKTATGSASGATTGAASERPSPDALTPAARFIGEWLSGWAAGMHSHPEAYAAAGSLLARRLADAGLLPVVPPDPPAVEVEALANAIAVHDAYHINDDGWVVCICGHVCVDDDDDGSHARHVADALLSSGVLVDAADVRASALEDFMRWVEDAHRRLWTEASRNDPDKKHWDSAVVYGINEMLHELRDRAARSRVPADTDTGRGQ